MHLSYNKSNRVFIQLYQNNLNLKSRHKLRPHNEHQGQFIWSYSVSNILVQFYLVIIGHKYFKYQCTQFINVIWQRNGYFLIFFGENTKYIEKIIQDLKYYKLYLTIEYNLYVLLGVQFLIYTNTNRVKFTQAILVKQFLNIKGL